MKKIEINNIQSIVDDYGVGLENRIYILGIEYDTENNGAELIVYNIEELENITTQKELNEYCDENGGDEESFEVERVTLVRVDSLEDKYLNNQMN